MMQKKIDRRRVKWSPERRAAHSALLKKIHAKRRGDQPAISEPPTFWQSVKKVVFG